MIFWGTFKEDKITENIILFVLSLSCDIDCS